MQTPTTSLEAMDPGRKRFIRAALIGILCANIATVLGGILYGYNALHEKLTLESLGFFVYVALDSEGTLLLAGSGAGLLSSVLLRRLGAVGGILVATVLVAGLGALVGYRFAFRATHISMPHAVLDLTVAWGFVALIVLSLAVWRGGGRR